MELKLIGDVRRQMINPGSSKPTMGLIHDGITGGNLLTRDNVKIDAQDAMNLLMYTTLKHKKLMELEKNRIYTGREIYSMILPDDLNVHYKKDGKTTFRIINSKLTDDGAMTKQQLGSSKNGLVHHVWNQYRHVYTKKFLDNTRRLVTQWLKINGFSVGMKEMILDKKLRNKFETMISVKRFETNQMITEMENNNVLRDFKLFETQIQGELNVLRDTIAKLVMNNLTEENAFNVMISSEARGTIMNMGQMVGCVGQQNIETKRVQKKMNGRTLPCYYNNDDGMDARGFVSSCFLYGLTPQEFFFHTMSGREGMIDTAIKTAETGYIQRKLVKALEDFMVKYDGTVRNARDLLTQPIYGESGIDMRYQVEQKISFILKNNKDIKEEYVFHNDEVKKYGTTENRNNEVYKKIIELRDLLRATQEKSIQNYSSIKDAYMCAVDMKTLLENYRNSNKYKKGTELDGTYVQNTITTILNNKYTPLMKMSEKQANDPTSYKYKDERAAKVVLEAGLYESLSPKKCCADYKFTKEQFDDLIAEFIEKFKRAVVQPGEMVGTLSAQSIGEPATQLSTFSRAKVLVYKKGKIIDTTIGEFIDSMMKNNDGVKTIKGSDILPLDKDDGIKILSISKKEKAKWCNVTELSRHPPHGKMIKIKTRTGRKVKATLSHSFLKRTKHGVEPIKGKDLKLGDRVPIALKTPVPPNLKTKVTIGDETYNFDKNFCKFIGFFVAEGSTCKSSDIICITTLQQKYQDLTRKIYKRFTNNTITTKDKEGYIMGSKKKYKGQDTNVICKELSQYLRKRCGTYCNNKRLPAFVFQLDLELLGSVLRGLFDGDGNVNGKKKSVKYHSTSKHLIEQVAFLLSYFGIQSTYSVERKAQKTDDGSELQDLWVLLIFGQEQGKIFYENIGTDLKYKKKQFKKYINGKKDVGQYVDQIPNIAYYVNKVGRGLALPGASRNYGRWIKKEEEGKWIGKRTLKSYIELFEEKDILLDYEDEIDKMKQAVDADVYWDEITELKIYDPDEDELVYDFSVETNETFAILAGLYVHNTLNTFHSAGTGAKTTASLGVPRLRELMSLSKNPKTPQMAIYLSDEYKNDKNMAHRIASNLVYTTINDVTKSVDIIYDPHPLKKGSIMEKDGVENVYMTLTPSKASCQSDISGLPWLIKITMNREAMLEKEITLLDIQNKFCEFWSSRYNDTRGMKKEDKLLMEKITKCSILANYDNSETPIIHLRLDMNNFNKGTLLLFKDTVLHKLKLKGIQGITEILDISHEPYIIYDSHGNMDKTQKRYVIYVSGVNIGEIRYMKGIDQNKVLTNHITELYNWYGIEVARRGLIKEFKAVLEANGSGTNYQHWTILVEAMTLGTMMISIDRNGMTKLDSDPLPRATFEKTVEQITIASVFREVDSMNSVSARIMTGQMIHGGTGLCKLFLDTKLLESTDLPDTSHDWKGKKFRKVTKDKIVKDLLEREADENEFHPD